MEENEPQGQHPTNKWVTASLRPVPGGDAAGHRAHPAQERDSVCLPVLCWAPRGSACVSEPHWFLRAHPSTRHLTGVP